MKTTFWMTIIGLVLWKCQIGQVSNASNVQVLTSDFVGWNNNVSNTIPVRFQHQANIGALSRFEWHTNISGTTAERMRLTNTGFLGLNTLNPSCLLEVNDGSILFRGNSGGIPMTGAGTRLMYTPSLGAFRVGTTTGSQWDTQGDFSFATGCDNTASGNRSFAAGDGNTASGEGAACFGHGTQATNWWSFAAGFGALAHGDVSVALNGGSVGTNADYSIAANTSDANGSRSFAFGENSLASGDYSGVLGKNLTASGETSFAIGENITNSISKSVMVGFESSTPTLFIGSESGTSVAAVGVYTSSPTERLDVAGTTRLRNMPVTTSPDALILGSGSTSGDYVLKYNLLNGSGSQYFGDDGQWHSIAAGSDCDWIVNGESDAYSSAGTSCATGNIGIGTNDPDNYRFVVIGGSADGSTSFGNAFFSNSDNNMGTTITAEKLNGGTGFYSRLSGGTSVQNRGIRCEVAVTPATNQTGYGVQGLAGFGMTALTNGNMYGVLGEAKWGRYNYGVYGRVFNPQPNDWAGWFQGDVNIQGGNLYINSVYAISDESLKNSIEPVQNGLEMVMMLQPSTYYYNETEYSGSDLPDELQYGLIAQQVEEVLPEIVNYVEFPEQYDTEGNITAEAMNIKTINYTALTPILISAVQDQQNQIEVLQVQLDNATANINTLSNALSECCAIDIQLKNMADNDIQIVPEAKELNELYQNKPNPFVSNTTIAYKLALAGQVRVLIYNQQGEIIATLVDGFNGSGLHQVMWQSGNLPAGVYYYALVVDGTELVKKAIKL